MDVPVSALRAELSTWIDRVRSGDEVVVTDRGVPVARLAPVDSAPRLTQLIREGRISRPESDVRPSAHDIPRVRPTEPVSVLVEEQRRARGL